jgi:hypothetical protein
MSTMISEVYDALKDAGASEEKARKAAEVLANYESQFADIKNELTTIKGDINLLRWMLGFVLAGVVTLIFKAFA